MTGKAEFNAEEWDVVAGAPLLAAMMVITADKGGSVRESLAVARAYAEARETHDGELMSALLASGPAASGSPKGVEREDLGAKAQAALREAIAILERVADPEEVAEYKRFAYSLAQSAAGAHREGGLLRRAKSDVSEAEQVALDAIAAVFDEPPAA